MLVLAVAVPCAATTPCPPPRPHNLFVTFTGSVSGCTAFGGTPCMVGEIVTFRVHVFQDQFCTDEFRWNFGDGAAVAIGREVTHAYVAAGVHEVEARIGPASWNLAVRQKVEMGPFCDLRPPEEPRRRSVRH